MEKHVANATCWDHDSAGVCWDQDSVGEKSVHVLGSCRTVVTYVFDGYQAV